MGEDFERCYRAVRSRDPRFDGWFYTAVRTTGIYCRPSCPATTPRRRNVRFFPTAAAAQGAGYRACRRCRPDAAPGSPEWDARSDLVGRAMRLIADGLVDRAGVSGLAASLGYSPRHLTRQLVAEVGAGPLALARAQRAQTARILVESSDLPLADVAFAAGFASIRQFNDTIRAVFAAAPSELRAAAAGRRLTDGRTYAPPAAPGPTAHLVTAHLVTVRLAYRRPCAAEELLGSLARHAVAGVEEATPGSYRRTLRLAHGPAQVALEPADGPADAHVRAALRLADLRDLTAAVARCRRLLDLDADPEAVDAHLGADPAIGGLVRAAPGRRVPGTPDGPELALRTLVGQQVSVAGARTVLARLVTVLGNELPAPDGGLTHLFPTPEALADAPDSALPMPAARARAVRSLAAALAAGNLRLDPGADRAEARQRLLALPGVGPWTAAYVLMRAFGDPDVFPATDLVLRRSAAALGLPGDPRGLTEAAARWRPWRSYAAAHLWAAAVPARSTDHPRSELSCA